MPSTFCLERERAHLCFHPSYFALQDVDCPAWLSAGPGPDLDSWDLSSLSPRSLVWCYYWFFPSDYYCYYIIMDLDWICINKSWANNKVTCVGSLLFLSASVTCKASHGIGSWVLSVLKAPATPVGTEGWLIETTWRNALVTKAQTGQRTLQWKALVM